VLVGEGDAAEATPGVDLGSQCGDVVIEIGAGIDQPRRVSANNPRVRAGQRERPRVIGPDPDELATRDLDASHAFSLTASPSQLERDRLVGRPGTSARKTTSM
jgi:hypothetical protein